MKNILIFGGCGFLGSWIVKALLKKNLKITIFDLTIKTDLLENLIGNELKKINFIDVSSKIAEEIDPRNPKLEFYAEWSKAALDYIKLVSENNGCNFYTFKWFGSYNTQPKTYPKKGLFIGEEDIFTLVNDSGLYNELSKPGSHPTEKILRFAFDKLISELEQIGYK